MTLSDVFAQTPFAHRALHDVTDGRPENSRAAVRAAVAAGYGIEIDLQLSADNVAMVFHDYSLDRLTGETGAVRQLSSDALGLITLTGGNEGIPTLAEILAIVGGKVPVLIELKDQDGAMGPDVGPLERATAQALVGYKGIVGLMSFNPHAVAEMARLCPDIPRGIVTSAYRADDWPLSAEVCDHLRGIPDYERVGASFISHEADDLSRPRVGALKSAGALVCCWTITDAEQEKRARHIADTITFEGYLAQRPA